MIFFYISFLGKDIKKLFALIILVLFPCLSFPQSAPKFNLPNNATKIVSKQKDAQYFFDQGIILLYSFDYGEATRSFTAATKNDSTCAMCFLGIAFSQLYQMAEAKDPNKSQIIKNAIEKAVSLSPNLPPDEKKFVTLFAKHNKTLAHHLETNLVIGCHPSSQEHSKISEKVRKALTDFHEVAVENLILRNLYIYMMLRHHKFIFWSWTGSPLQDTNMLIELLEKSLSSNNNNLGALHFYIHIIESSPHPHKALKVANSLREIDAPHHLVHMPSHIYYLMGDYHKATYVNQKAIRSYQRYQEDCARQGFLPIRTNLSFHEYDYLKSSASMEGRSKLAINSTKRLSYLIKQASLEEDLEWYLPLNYFMLSRFGRWDNILALKKPNPNLTYLTAMWHYVRAQAYLKKDQTDLAKKEKDLLETLVDNADKSENTYSQFVLAKAILDAMFASENNNQDSVIKNLNLAKTIQNFLGYQEPPTWYFQVDEMIGHAYYKFGDYTKAIEAYKASLKIAPKNGWALYYLQKSYEKLGKIESAKKTQNEFKTAWRYADIPIPVNLFLMN